MFFSKNFDDQHFQKYCVGESVFTSSRAKRKLDNLDFKFLFTFCMMYTTVCTHIWSLDDLGEIRWDPKENLGFL